MGVEDPIHLPDQAVILGPYAVHQSVSVVGPMVVVIGDDLTHKPFAGAGPLPGAIQKQSGGVLPEDGCDGGPFVA